MIKFTPRLNKAINTAALAHAQINQKRKGTNLPFIVHPFGVMIVACQVTDDEDILIACLFHDILEDVEPVNPQVYNQSKMRQEFGDRVTNIVFDVSHSPEVKDWHSKQTDYDNYIKNKASKEAVIVSAADKVHNLTALVDDYKLVGPKLANRFSTKSLQDQQIKYKNIIEVLEYRKAPSLLLKQLNTIYKEFSELINST